MHRSLRNPTHRRRALVDQPVRSNQWDPGDRQVQSRPQALVGLQDLPHLPALVDQPVRSNQWDPADQQDRSRPQALVGLQDLPHLPALEDRQVLLDQ